MSKFYKSAKKNEGVAKINIGFDLAQNFANESGLTTKLAIRNCTKEKAKKRIQQSYFSNPWDNYVSKHFPEGGLNQDMISISLPYMERQHQIEDKLTFRSLKSVIVEDYGQQ